MRYPGADYLYGSVAIADLDNDGSAEIIFADRWRSTGGFLHALRADGSELPGFPYTMSGEVTAAAVLGDADHDGVQNLLFQSKDQRIYLLEFPGVAYVAAENPWPMFRQNVRRDGCYEPAPSVAVALECFKASAEEGGVRVTWQNARPGLVLWTLRRGEAGALFEHATLLNERVIVTRDREEASYFDEGTNIENEPRYWLLATLPSGEANRFGPVVAAPCHHHGPAFPPPGPNPFSPMLPLRLVVPEGGDAWGRETPSGVYFARAQIGEFSAAQRIVRSR